MKGARHWAANPGRTEGPHFTLAGGSRERWAIRRRCWRCSWQPAPHPSPAERCACVRPRRPGAFRSGHVGSGSAGAVRAARQVLGQTLSTRAEPGADSRGLPIWRSRTEDVARSRVGYSDGLLPRRLRVRPGARPANKHWAPGPLPGGPCLSYRAAIRRRRIAYVTSLAAAPQQHADPAQNQQAQRRRLGNVGDVLVDRRPSHRIEVAEQ